MPPSDRAFRALGREEPDVLVSLLRATGLPIPGRLTPIDVSDPKLDAPAHPLEADFVAHTADGDVLHVECQGYRDASFEERLPRYHLALALRFWPRRVRTVAVWLAVPPVHQRRTVIPHGNIEVHVTPIVLPELDAELLLHTPEAACFAAAAGRGTWSEQELTRHVAAALVTTNASARQRHMAAVAAHKLRKYRYDCLTAAAEELHMQPIIIEDLVKIGEDMGLERGRAEGLELGRAEGKAEGKAEGVLAVLEARGVAVPDPIRRRVIACTDVAKLDAWIRRAAVVSDAAELGD